MTHNVLTHNDFTKNDIGYDQCNLSQTVSVFKYFGQNPQMLTPCALTRDWRAIIGDCEYHETVHVVNAFPITCIPSTLKKVYRNKVYELSVLDTVFNTVMRYEYMHQTTLAAPRKTASKLHELQINHTHNLCRN